MEGLLTWNLENKSIGNGIHMKKGSDAYNGICAYKVKYTFKLILARRVLLELLSKFAFSTWQLSRRGEENKQENNNMKTQAKINNDFVKW
ncbi:Hypothetical predicted protein [Octopus vulgaris]|uniref:Uncharacterized protein n=1 Tax=Octopus vulgaris TaxID=6645 RepID=A0AA36B7K1_OCTVU|nr:Hypothetical predicted protein [Octopus vulgaris]